MEKKIDRRFVDLEKKIAEVDEGLDKQIDQKINTK